MIQNFQMVKVQALVPISVDIREEPNLEGVITTIDMRSYDGNPVSDYHVIEYMKRISLGEHQDVKNVFLNGNVTPLGLRHVEKMFYAPFQANKLNLGNIILCAETMQWVTHLITDSSCSLRDLIVTIGPDSVHLINSFFTALLLPCSIFKLGIQISDLNGVQMNTFTAMVAFLMRHNTTIQYMILLTQSQSHFESYHLADIGDSLRSNLFMKEFSLIDKRIPTDGVNFLMQGVRENISLQSIYIRTVTHIAVDDVCEMIKSNPILENVYIGLQTTEALHSLDSRLHQLLMANTMRKAMMYKRMRSAGITQGLKSYVFKRFLLK